MIHQLRNGDLTNILEYIDKDFDHLKIEQYFNLNLVIRNKKQLIQMVDQLHNLDGIVLEYVPNMINREYIQGIKKRGLCSMIRNYPEEDNFSMVCEMLEAEVDLINTNQLDQIFSKHPDLFR